MFLCIGDIVWDCVYISVLNQMLLAKNSAWKRIFLYIISETTQIFWWEKHKFHHVLCMKVVSTEFLFDSVCYSKHHLVCYCNKWSWRIHVQMQICFQRSLKLVDSRINWLKHSIKWWIASVFHRCQKVLAVIQTEVSQMQW